MNIAVNPRALTCPVALLSTILASKRTEWDVIGGDRFAMDQGLWVFRRAATWLPPECDDGMNFHVELIGLYIDLIEDDQLDDDEEIEGWKAIGRMITFVAAQIGHRMVIRLGDDST